MEIGDEDPRKVNPTPPVGDELVRDFETNLPDTPDISPPDYFVNKELTISNYEYILKLDLLSKYIDKINIELVKQGGPELVNKLLTKSGLMLLSYISEHPAFTVPTIFRKFKKCRQQIYPIIDKLKGLKFIKKTKYQISPPYSQQVRGFRPFLHTLADVIIEGTMDPLYLDAQREYWDVRFKHGEVKDILSIKTLQKTICQQLVDNLVKRGYWGHTAPQTSFIITQLKNSFPEVDPKNRYPIALEVCKILSEWEPPLEAVPRVAEEGEL